MTHKTNSIAGLPQPGIDAVREGRSIKAFVNDKTGVGTATVLTNATDANSGFPIPIAERQRVVISDFYVYLSTASDWATLEIVATERSDGSGVVEALTPKFRMDTGTPTSAVMPVITHFPTPVIVTRSCCKTIEAHAVSVRIQGNDASAAITCGIYGWVEDDTAEN